jgi:predicted dehydrogenase
MQEMNDKKTMNRRSFLTVSAAASAGLILSSSGRARSAPSTNDDVNVAIIGSGAQGQVLLNACLNIPGLHFRAVCDIWADWNRKRSTRLLMKYGHQVNEYEDYRDLLAKEKDLDAVLIATPDFWHHRHAIDCLEAGLNVYCEKEMSNDLNKAREMVLTARRTGKLLQVGHQRRSNPRYIHCYKKLLTEAKILGRITTINAQWNRAVQEDIGWPKKYPIKQDVLKKYGFDNMHQFRNWRWYKQLGGGAIVDLGSHQIDIFSWFLNAKPKSVMASGGTDYYEKKTHEWYDTVQTLWEYDTSEGVVRVFYQTITTNSCQGYFETFMGDEGTLQISESASRGSVYREVSNPNAPLWDKWIKMGYITAPQVMAQPATVTGLDVRETVAPPKHDIAVEMNVPYHQPHLENFFNAVRGVEELNCPGDVGYETAVSVLKVNQAVETGRRLFFKPEEFQV